MIDTKVQSTCRCCKGDAIEYQKEIGLNRCHSCGYRWQVHVKSFQYNQSYLEFGYNGAPLAAMSWIRISFVFTHTGFCRLLDIGCGSGIFVRTAKQVGFNAFGFDIHNIDLGDSVPRVKDWSGQWGVVTLFDSFEHIEDLESVLLIDTEFFIVTLPHLDAAMSIDSVKRWKHYKPDEHLHYFTKSAIVKLFEKHGFKMIDCVNFEDMIRKPVNGSLHPNTMTYVFKKFQ